VIRLASIQQFLRFRSARSEPSVRLRCLRPARRFGRPDAVADSGKASRHCATWQPSSQPHGGAELERFRGGVATCSDSAVALQMLGKALEIPRGWRGGGGAGGGWRHCGGPRLFAAASPLRAAKALCRQCQAQPLARSG